MYWTQPICPVETQPVSETTSSTDTTESRVGESRSSARRRPRAANASIPRGDTVSRGGCGFESPDILRR